MNVKHYLFFISLGFSQVDYQTEIQTIFYDKCTSCHVDGSSGGLALNTYSTLMAGGNSAPSIVAGDHQNSLLWKRIKDGSMPPGSNNVSLTKIELIAKWIDEGALEQPNLSVDRELIPTKYILHDAYPNPFNPSTSIRFVTPDLTDVSLIIYNSLGQKIKTYNLVNLSPGYHKLKWDATNDLDESVPTGVYLYQMKSNSFVATRKMVYMK